MYNYYTDLIWAIDKALFLFLISFVFFIIFYAAIKELRFKRHCRVLLNIKKNIYESLLSGKNISHVTSSASIEQFLDVTTNRNRDIVFFNDAEQKLFKGSFITAQKISKLHRLALKSSDKWQRVEAILTLGYAQDASSVDILKKTLNGKDADIAYFSINSLGQIHNSQSADTLLDFVSRRNFCRYKIFSLLEVFPPEIAKQIISLISSPDAQVRAWAVRLLAQLKAVQYLKQIESLTKDKSEEVRVSACDCLAEFAIIDAKNTLVRCLKDDYWMVRASAIKALVKILGKDSLPEIMASINDGSLSVIDCLKSAMIEHIEPALLYIEKFLFGNDEMAKRVSVEALEASGYVLKLFKDIIVSSGKDKARDRKLLEGLAISRAHAGIVDALVSFNEADQSKLLNMIRGIDNTAAELISQKIAAYKQEPL